jgi:hypothetical protein
MASCIAFGAAIDYTAPKFRDYLERRMGLAEAPKLRLKDKHEGPQPEPLF